MQRQKTTWKGTAVKVDAGAAVPVTVNVLDTSTEVQTIFFVAILHRSSLHLKFQPRSIAQAPPAVEQSVS
jgi:hypothetical protein